MAVLGADGRSRGGALRPAARYQDCVGHPVALTRAFWPRLLELTGDQGARELLMTVPVVEVEMPGAAPLDVDTPDGLRGAVEGSSSTLL